MQNLSSSRAGGSRELFQGSTYSYAHQTKHLQTKQITDIQYTIIWQEYEVINIDKFHCKCYFKELFVRAAQRILKIKLKLRLLWKNFYIKRGLYIGKDWV